MRNVGMSRNISEHLGTSWNVSGYHEILCRNFECLALNYILSGVQQDLITGATKENIDLSRGKRNPVL